MSSESKPRVWCIILHTRHEAQGAAEVRRRYMAMCQEA